MKKVYIITEEQLEYLKKEFSSNEGSPIPNSDLNDYEKGELYALKCVESNSKEVDLDDLRGLLLPLRDSCGEGFNQTWDCSTSEGREGFISMLNDCERVMRELGIKYSEYPLNEE